MTDKNRIEKTYQKIKTKYPDITAKEEIDNLAIKLDKRNTLLISLCWFLGAVACGFIFFLLMGNENYETTWFLSLIMMGSGLFECFRTLGKYSTIEKRYRPVLKVKYEGHLNKDRILNDGGQVLKKAGYEFSILKIPLFDKEDETDIGMNNDTHHKYYLYFKHGDNGQRMAYRVNRTVYMDAIIGAGYYVVVTPSNEIAAVYQATNWSSDNDILPYIVASSADITGDIVTEKAENIKTKKLLPTLALVLIALCYCMPIIIGVPMGIAALVLAIVGIARQRSKLSVISLIITVALFLLLTVSVGVMFAELV